MYIGGHPNSLMALKKRGKGGEALHGKLARALIRPSLVSFETSRHFLNPSAIFEAFCKSTKILVRILDSYIFTAGSV